MKQKTILHIIDTTGPGGAETVFLELVKKTHEQGYHAIALIRGPGWVKSQLDAMGTTTLVFNSKGSLNLSFLKFLLSTVREYQVDVIQAHLFGSALYASLAAIFCRVPTFSTIHGLVDISPNEKFKGLKTLILSLGSTKLLAVTDRINQLLTSLPFIPATKVQTIYNGIDLSRFEKIACHKLSSQLPKHDLVIGSLGNIRQPKNYPLAIETIAQLHKQGIIAHYFIAGQGNEAQMQPLLQLAEQHKISEYFHLLGFIDNAQEFLSELDIFLMTSSSEGHPLALTQAMACKLPIVTTPNGVQEIIDHDVEAIITTEHKSELLAEGIHQLYLDKSHAEKISNNAFNKSKALFSLDAMCNQYLQLYSNH